MKISTTQKDHVQGESHHVQTVSHVVEAPISRFKTAFVKWTSNISSVHFDNIIVHSPTNADEAAVIYDKPTLMDPLVSLENILAIPEIGNHQIASTLETFEKGVKEFEEMKKKIERLEAPKPIRKEPVNPLILWVGHAVIIIGATLLIIFIHKKASQNCKRRRNGKCNTKKVSFKEVDEHQSMITATSR